MELLESQDPEKKRLIEASNKHKRELEKQVSALGNDTQKLITNALVIGGVLAATYFVVRQFSSSGSSKKRKKTKVTLVQPKVSKEDDEDDVEYERSPGLMADIGMKLANQATVILVDLARQKLMEYLESRKKD